MTVSGSLPLEVLRLVVQFMPVASWSIGRTVARNMLGLVHKIAAHPEGLRLILEEGYREPMPILPFTSDVFVGDLHELQRLRQVFDCSTTSHDIVLLQRLTSDTLVALFPFTQKRSRHDVPVCVSMHTEDQLNKIMLELFKEHSAVLETPEDAALWSCLYWALRQATHRYVFTMMYMDWSSQTRPGGSNELRALLWENRN